PGPRGWWMHAVGEDHELVAWAEQFLLNRELGLEHSEQRPGRMPIGWFAIGRHMQWVRVGSPRERQRPIPAVELRVEHGDERRLRQAQIEQVAVEPVENLTRRNQPVRFAK